MVMQNEEPGLQRCIVAVLVRLLGGVSRLL